MNTFFSSDRKVWRKWLEDHFESEKEVWVVFPTLASGEDGMLYNDSVEEALCFGWIDGQLKKLDDTHILRRFTPRRKGSGYSRPNIERLIWLEEHGMIHPKVRPAVLPLIETPYVLPKDIIAELKKDPEVWSKFEHFSESYRRIRIAYIDDARRRPEEFAKRLNSFIVKTKQGKIISGYGGIEKYYEMN